MTEHLAEALDLARAGRGIVEPNPQVGAVVVKDGVVVGRGAHRVFGGPHAEIEALNDAGDGAQGATLYVTLEPCSTHGKTPPCTRAIVNAGIKDVVWAVDDPNPDHDGRAAGVLEAAGVGVTRNAALPEGQELLCRFVAARECANPFVIAKWAQTLDGVTTTPPGAPPEITGLESRTRVHADRATCCGILIGSGTAIADNPSLTVRLVEDRSPHRFVLDSELLTPVSAQLLNTPPSTTFYCGPDADEARRQAVEAAGARVVELNRGTGGLDLPQLLASLYKNGIHRLFVEGGETVHGSFFREGLVDFVQIYIADASQSDRTDAVAEDLISRLRLIDAVTEPCGADILLTGYCS